jgi:ABC-type molybdate transport system permease subunit
MLVAVPLGLMSAIYLSEYARPRVRTVVKPLLEILAGIPTVVYGFFAALTVAPLIRALGGKIGLAIAPESALAAGLVMGVMIIPFISSLSDDVISAVPQSLRDGSLGLGATRSETIRRVVIPAALPGIVSGILLAVSRAIGETMIVGMAAGLAAKLTANPLQSVTTVTVQIVTLLVGDQEQAPGRNFFMPTLLADVTAHMRVYREENFAPVAGVLAWDDLEQLIVQANDTEYGLAAYVYGYDMRQVWRLLRGLEFGMVSVNSVKMTGPPVPFGGVKQSGLGREGSRHGLDEYSQIKYYCLGNLPSASGS